MRYTLRLLTAQQFQRATALMCAAELARREDEATWGVEPFRIGLWVGTDVSPKRFEEADEQLKKANEYGSHRLTVLQIQRCPWCGTPITAAQVQGRRDDASCVRPLRRRAGPLPVLQGRRGHRGAAGPDGRRGDLPAHAGVRDRHGRQVRAAAREGEAAALFGYVSRRCGRHGYVHADYARVPGRFRTRPNGGQPAATVRPVGRLRPPDLIIQDELHLITGALGTAVGLFEVAVETLSSWETPDGKPVKPLIVASTATVRNAQEQVRGLYGRQVEIFPPQVLDVADTFFSQEVPIDRENPGRRYIGVSAQGVRLSSAEIRVVGGAAVRGAAAVRPRGCCGRPVHDAGRLLQRHPRAGGHGALHGRRRRRTAWATRPRTRASRAATAPPSATSTPRELTSRIASAEIGRTLDRLGLEFDPAFDSTEAFQARLAARKADQKVTYRNDSPFDVVLATSMLQVGVDVQRLGLMLVVGQPKNTAEYIQASSRVGRDASDRPGLVVALGQLGSASRPRPLRAVPALPRDVLRPGRGAVGDAVLADLAGPRHRRPAGQRRARHRGGNRATGCRPSATPGASRTSGRSSRRWPSGSRSGSPQPRRARTPPSAPTTCW